MYYQNDERLPNVINRIGCFFISCLYHAEVFAGSKLTIDQITDIWTKAKASGFINSKNEIKDSASTINLGFEALHSDHKAIEVCTITNGNVSYYPWTDAQPKYKRYDCMISKARIKNPKSEHFHFRAHNACGVLTFDPYDPSVAIEGEVYRIGYYIK